MGKLSLILVTSLFFVMMNFVIFSNKNQTSAVREMVSSYDTRMAQNLANSYAGIYLNNIHTNNNVDWEPDDWSSVEGYCWAAAAHKKTFSNGEKVTLVKETDLAQNPNDPTTLVAGQVRITSISEVGDAECQTIVYDNRIAYSYYGLFVNKFRSSYYWDGEILKGPIHSNEQFRIGGREGPIVDGNISVAQNLVTYTGQGLTEDKWKTVIKHDGLPNFRGDWIKEGANPIAFRSDYSWLATSTEDNGSIDTDFPGTSDLHIVLLDDGRVAVSNKAIWPADVELNATNSPHETKIYSVAELQSKGKVLSSKNHNLHIQGTLNGQLTISTRKSVYIDDDVKYKNDPRIPGNENSTDMLAIMSKGNQYLSTEYITYERANNSTKSVLRNPGPNGVEVMACMFTEGTIKPQSTRYGYRGHWTTYGSRVENEVVQTFSDNRWGFKEAIEYDTRFRKTLPPGMPWTRERRIFKWYETA